MKIIAAPLGDRPFDEMEKSDVKDLMKWLHSEYDNQNTLYTYKSVVKSFWKWMGGGEEYPETVEWVKLNNPSGNGTLPEELLTKDDIEAQIAVTHNAQDAAFIWMLYETGARIGELSDLTVGGIEDRKNGGRSSSAGRQGRAGSRWSNRSPTSTAG